MDTSKSAGVYGAFTGSVLHFVNYVSESIPLEDLNKQALLARAQTIFYCKSDAAVASNIKGVTASAENPSYGLLADARCVRRMCTCAHAAVSERLSLAAAAVAAVAPHP